MKSATISDEALASFERDGAVCLRGVIGDEWLESLRQASPAAMELAPSEPGMIYFKRIRLWPKIPVFGEFCTRSALPQLAALMLRTDKINLLYDQLFVKEPHMVDRTVWQPYWPVRGWPAMSFWVPLDPVDEATGALEFIKGSHAWNAWYQPIHGDEQGRLRSTPEPRPGFIEMPDFEAQRERHEMLKWEMEPGDVIAFHALTLHGSTGNTSRTRVRRAYSVRYAGRDTRYFDTTDLPGRNLDLLNPALKTGDPLDSEMFPVVYEA